MGLFALMVGSLLLGAATLVKPPWWRTRFPAGGAITLMAGSLTFFLSNTEAARAWFALPDGAAWIAVV